MWWPGRQAGAKRPQPKSLSCSAACCGVRGGFRVRRSSAAVPPACPSAVSARRGGGRWQKWCYGEVKCDAVTARGGAVGVLSGSARQCHVRVMIQPKRACAVRARVRARVERVPLFALVSPGMA